MQGAQRHRQPRHDGPALEDAIAVNEIDCHGGARIDDDARLPEQINRPCRREQSVLPGPGGRGKTRRDGRRNVRADAVDLADNAVIADQPVDQFV